MIDSIKKRALHRTRIIEGQIRGIQKMLANDDYCVDIMTQNLAVQKSLSSLNKLILENHIRTHVKKNLSSNDETMSEKTLEELLDLYELKNVRGR